MKLKERLLTYEDIGSIPEGYEVVRGRLKELVPTGGEHGFFEQKIARKVDEKYEAHGYVLVGEVGLIVSKDPLTIRAADIVYISKDRCPTLPKGMLEIPPDLVVEIVSPGNTYEEIEDRISDYIDFGVKRIAVIEPGIRKVTLIDEERRISIKSFDEEVELLPDLRIRISDLTGGKR